MNCSPDEGSLPRIRRDRTPGAVLGALCAAFGALAAFAAPAHAACDPALKAFVAAAKAADAAAARGHMPEIERRCSAKQQILARNGLGKLHARLTVRELEAGAAPGPLRTRLRDWQRFGDHWELQQTLGILATRERDHVAAAEHYMRALDLIEDAASTPKKPDASVVSRLHRRATDALSLSAEYVSARTRSGETRAYFRRSFRGFKVPVKRPQVTFLVDTAQFDSVGARAVRELGVILAREATPASPIVVVGHADPEGEDDYNLELSRRRVQATIDELRRTDYSGAFIVVACGERIRPEITDEHLRSTDEIFRLHRRVEVFYRREDFPAQRYGACDVQG